MSDVIEIAAAVRERAGKGSARAARREGHVPGIIYGSKKDPLMITLEERELVKRIHTAGFFATLIDVNTGSNKERVLARDVQFDPVSDKPIHVDLLRVSATTEVTVDVPVVFLNEEACPGLTKGGVLNVVRHEIEVICRADVIPQHIDIDLTGLDIGDGVHISMVALPGGVRPAITDRDFTIATIAAPKLVIEEVEEETEGEDAEAEAEGEAAEETEAGETASED